MIRLLSDRTDRISEESYTASACRIWWNNHMMKKQAFLCVNLAVLLFGLAGLFAKWIQLPAICITFGRVFFSSISLGIFMRIRRQSYRIPDRKSLLLLICAGMVLALHWWSFLESIQRSTVAVGTITFSTFPLFVMLLEALLLHRKPERRNIVIGVILILGVLITIPEFSFENHMFLGAMAGMVSALSYAVLTLQNKLLTQKCDSTAIAFYEQTTAAVVLLPFVLSTKAIPTPADTGLLLLLGVVTTAFAHTLFITSLKSLPAHLAGICSSMETVYGILFALILLGEVPSFREVIGALVIIITVFFAQARAES